MLETIAGCSASDIGHNERASIFVSRALWLTPLAPASVDGVVRIGGGGTTGKTPAAGKAHVTTGLRPQLTEPAAKIASPRFD